MIGLGVRSGIKNAIQYRRRRAIYNIVKDYTMISEETFCNNIAIAEKVSSVPGCIVECGVWRGGMSAGLCVALGPDRTYLLFDSFEGLPPAQSIDGAAAIKYQSDKSSPCYHDNCTASPELADRAMKMAGAKRFELVAGWFEKTLPNFKFDEPIALLRLDADWYESTMTCLNYLFDHVASNGLIVIDDYYTWDGCSRALHDFLSARKATERIHSFRDSICYIEKRSKR